MKITASIVIYDEKKEVLKKAIESFLSLNFKKELIIIDNSSSNDLEEFCKQFDIKYIYSNKNLGFGAGHNLAFKYFIINSDIHLIINPDIYFETKKIENFLEWFYYKNDISLAVPKVLNPNNSIQHIVRNVPTLVRLIQRKLKINSDEIYIEDNIIKEIPVAHGSFLVFKTDIFRKLKGFDERFFIYMEDIDIFVRAKKYGKTVINSHYHIYHYWSKGSSKQLKLFFYHLISALRFFRKHGYK